MTRVLGRLAAEAAIFITRCSTRAAMNTSFSRW